MKQIILVGTLNQSITLERPADRQYGDPAFRMTGLATSGLALSYSRGEHADTASCTVTSDGLVEIGDAGICEVKAEQAGNGRYAAAPAAYTRFTVLPRAAGAPFITSVAANNESITATFREPSYKGGSAIRGYRIIATPIGELDDASSSPQVSSSSSVSSSAPVSDPNDPNAPQDELAEFGFASQVSKSSEVVVDDTCMVPNTNENQRTVTCEIVGLVNNQAYVITVAVITDFGVGLESAASVPKTPRPNYEAPQQVTGISDRDSVQITWTAPLATSGDILSYEVWIRQVGGDFGLTPMTLSAQALSATIAICELPGSDVECAAPATSQSSSVSSISQVAFFGITLTQQNDSGEFSIWQAISDFLGAISQFVLSLFGIEAGFTQAAPATQIAYTGFEAAQAPSIVLASTSSPSVSSTVSSSVSPTTSAGIQKTAEYEFKIVTITTVYSSEAQVNTNSITQQIVSTPSAPAMVDAVANPDRTMFISWASATYDGGAEITSYVVKVNGNQICSVGVTTSACVFNNWGYATTYNVSVAAVNDIGVGRFQSISLTTENDPTPPQVQTVTPTSSATVSPTVSATVSPTVSPTTSPTTSPKPKPGTNTDNDGDGIPNDQDSDIDGDGTANGDDSDIDGDGTPNTGDTDPTETGGGEQPPLDPNDITNPEQNGSGESEAPASITDALAELFGPQANPAIGATGDDAVLQEFSPLGSPESIAAVVELALKSLVIAAAAAAAVGAAAAAAAGAASSAGAAAGSAGSSGSSGSSGGSSSANTARPEGEEGDEDLSELEVAHDQIELVEENWGDKLAWFKSRWLTFLDKLTHDLTLLIAPISPLIAKVINDGAYLRAMLGSTTLLLPFAGVGLALTAVFQNAGEVFAPTWYLMLAIALLGLFDAFAGFAATLVFLVGTVIAAGNLPDMSQVRTLMGVMIIAIGPAMLATAFRTLRKSPARDQDSWWERIVDLAIAPMMAGWSVMTMVSVMPSISGLTLNMANHVTDFGIAIAIAAAFRVLLEEGAARYFPARLNKINPTELPDSPLIQKAIALLIRYGIWVVLSGAIVGFGWQAFVGSALFLLPTIVGWYQDRFPNVPWIWRILPTGVPGLAFTILVASGSSAALSIWLGATPAFAELSFVILPLPLLVLSVLSMFGREGATEDEVRIAQRNRWVYRLGGVVMLLVTLNLTGII